MRAMRKLRRIDLPASKSASKSRHVTFMIFLYEPMTVPRSQVEPVNRPHLFDVTERPLLNGDLPSSAWRVIPSSKSPNDRSRYSASALRVLTSVFSIRAPSWTRCIIFSSALLLHWDNVTKIPM